MMDEWRYVAEFSAGEEFHRILPVGKFSRFGRKVEITPDKVRDMVANFNRSIPDTGVPINAEHARTEGRVGQVTGLVDRADGAYAALQFTEAGQRLIAEERFQYVSPEIVWGPTDWEEHENISNILVGLALTNSPFFGQGVSLFTLNDQEVSGQIGFYVPEQKIIDPDLPPTDWSKFKADKPQVIIVGEAYPELEKVTVGTLSTAGSQPIYQGDGVRDYLEQFSNDGGTDDPPIEPNEEELVEEQKFFEKFTQWLEGREKQTPPEKPNGSTPEEFAALQTENKELKAKLSEQQAEQEHAARVAEYSAIVPDAAPDYLPEDLARFAAVNPEAAKRLAEEVATLYGQVEEAGLFREVGSDSSDVDEYANDADQFRAEVERVSKEKGIPEDQAMNLVAKERPKLVEAVRNAARRD